MPYTITKPSITLQCDYCTARQTYSGESISACKFAARDDGWKMYSIKVIGSESGNCRCDNCRNK